MKWRYIRKQYLTSGLPIRLEPEACYMRKDLMGQCWPRLLTAAVHPISTYLDLHLRCRKATSV